ALAGLIDPHLPAERGADLRSRGEGPLRRRVVARPGEDVAVAEVEEVATGAPQAGLEVLRAPDVTGLSVDPHPTLADLLDQRGRGVTRGAIVDHLDLQSVRAGVLRQHALQRLAQVVGAVVSRDHLRPQGTLHAVLDRWDSRPVRMQRRSHHTTPI